DYFAIPAHVTWQEVALGDGVAPFTGGTVLGLGWSALSGVNNATIGGSVSSIRISVVDGSGRCPQDYMTAQRDAGWNATTRTFNKNME
ncbi:MAG: hypothetical protein D3924_03970, partial [Candidatus Electrothrix sp. AR4]|nr:hypothetical protein [Candidatus Electrothrix sp. AR4]